jgi:hypothetical protein
MKFSGRRKFKAKWTKDARGVNHPSESEARWYDRLYAREARGEIKELTLNPSFPIVVAHQCPHCAEHGQKLAVAELDAGYTEVATGEYVYADYKGIEGETPVSKLKRAFVEARFGIKVTLFGPAAARERKKAELAAFKRAEREKQKAARAEAKRTEREKKRAGGQLNMTL